MVSVRATLNERYVLKQTPDLTFNLMKTERKTILRKVYEAMLIFIYEYKPSINDKVVITLYSVFVYH